VRYDPVKRAKTLYVVEFAQAPGVAGHITIAHPQGVNYVAAEVLPGHPGLTAEWERERFLTLLERVRTTFQARLFAYGIDAQGVRLVVAPRDHRQEPEARLRDRWRRLSPRSVPPTARLRARLGSLSGFMQTALQRFTRDSNQRHGCRGGLWAGHYRSTALADDRSLLAALSWIESAPGLTSQGNHDLPREVLSLAPPPLRTGPGDFLCPADEAPPGCFPVPEGTIGQYLQRFAGTISVAAGQAHGRALAAGWALGRPESLGGVISQLGRTRGRGRMRQVRDLDDELGLCGVWG